AGAGAVAILVHGDLAGNAGEALQPAQAFANPVAILIQILGLVGHAGFLEAVLVRVNDVVGARPAIGRQLTVHPGGDLLDVFLHFRARIVEPCRGRHVGTLRRLAGDLDEAWRTGAGTADDRHVQALLLHLLGD